MKKKFLFFALIIVGTWANSVQAQVEKPTILKISYLTSPLSAKMTAIIKSQMPDPQEYANYMQEISRVKIYHSLYVDTRTNESVYKLDSIKEVEGINLAGQVDFCHKVSSGKFTGQETFAGSSYYFNGEVNNLQWVISKETKTVGKYICTKAILKSSPDVSVWFTTQIPVSNGPEYYYGLPGLVVEFDNYFESCSVLKLTYTNDTSIFKNIVAKVQDQVKGKSILSLQKVVTSKQNFITMAEEKMKTNR